MFVTDEIDMAPAAQRTATPRRSRNPLRLLRFVRYRILLLLVVLAGIAAAATTFVFMPGKSYRGALPPADDETSATATRLRADVKHLAEKIGERNLYQAPEALAATANFIDERLRRLGYDVTFQEYEIDEKPVRNIEVELPGGSRCDEIVIIGAHYDSVPGCPAANDNGSGVVSLLELVRSFGKPYETSGSATELHPNFSRTLRFVFFVNEEPPYFQTKQMGSWVYAARCTERHENIVAMLSLETMGYFTDEPGSQKFPSPILKAVYPTTGNFIGFIGGSKSKRLVKQVVKLFRENANFPSEGAALPDMVPGVGWSDHWAFGVHGYQALMVTDTAPFRYPHYHEHTDTPEKLNYERMARVVIGLRRVITELVK